MVRINYFNCSLKSHELVIFNPTQKTCDTLPEINANGYYIQRKYLRLVSTECPKSDISFLDITLWKTTNSFTLG